MLPGTFLMNDAASSNPFASPAFADSSAPSFEANIAASPLTEEAQLLAAARHKLAQVRFWILSSGILLFVLAAFMGIATFFAVFKWESSLIVSNSVNTFIYLASAILLWKFYRNVVQFMRETETRNLEELYESESSYWKFLGLITLGSIALFAVVMLLRVFLGPAMVRAFSAG
jgi:hypothetical protein